VYCNSENCSVLFQYETKSNGDRDLFKCCDCGKRFSETKLTFMQNIKTPISKIATVLNARTEGMSFNATCRVHENSSHTLQDWECKFGQLKSVLMLYALTHNFLELLIEGDELYTRIHSNKAQEMSEGWTIMLLDRASRFIWELSCDEKQEMLFMRAMECLVEVIEKTDELSLLTDGERRYSKALFQICHETLHTGEPGRPKKVLKQGVKVRLKNKGSQSHKKGPKRDKYEAPKPEHPETKQNLQNKDVHANHSEGQNAAIRRKNSTYRRRTNTYAKCKPALQRTLDVYWVVHNFIRKHYTTKAVPAVKIGIIEKGFSWDDVMNVRMAF